MAFEVFMMNPPKRRRKARTLKSRRNKMPAALKRKLLGLRRKPKRSLGLAKRFPALSSRVRGFRRGRFGRNIGPYTESGTPEIIYPPSEDVFGGYLKKWAAEKKATRKRGRKSAKRRISRKGTTKMAKRRRGRPRVRRIGKRISKRKFAALITRARRHKSPLSYLKRRGASKRRIKRYAGSRKRLSAFAAAHPINFIYGHKRVSANRRRRSRRRYAKNAGLTTWQRLVKRHGVKGAKRVYRGNKKSRRGRRRYRKNRESYQISPVAANRSRRRYRRNRELYQVAPGFSANPATAALAFPKAVFSVPFIMKNVVPLAVGAIGSDLLAGLLTKHILKDKKWSDAPWKKAALTAGAGVLGGLGIGMATKGRKADWAYKFAAGGLTIALLQMFNSYIKSKLGLGGMGLGEYSGIGYGSDDLKRRIAEELKTELDGVSGFMTQEDLDSGVSSIGSNAVSGFVTSEDLPSESSSVSMDDFIAAPAY